MVEIQGIADFVGMVETPKVLCPDKQVLVYPKYKGAVAKLADKVASTSGMFKHAVNSLKKGFMRFLRNWDCNLEIMKVCPNQYLIPFIHIED